MNAGRTTHFRVSFDSLAIKSAASKLVPICDGDYELVSGWFGGVALPNEPVEILVSGYPPSTRSLPSGGLAFSPGRLPALSRVRYMFVYELSKRLMRVQDRGWIVPDGSGQGPAVARFLAAQVLAERGEGQPEPELQPANAWMASERSDYLGRPGKGEVAAGCRVLFLYYLHVQLGFAVPEIVAAAAPTLSEAYHTLAGTAEDPFPPFKALLESRYPGTETISGHPDNPWPMGETGRQA